MKFTAEPENPSSRVVLGWNPSQTQTDDLTESEGWTSKTKMLNPEEGHTIFFTVKPEESNNVGAYLVMINGTDCNNDLESLKVFTSDRKQEFALSPNFDPDVTEYSIEVPAETKTICLAADASSPMAGVLVNGQQYDYYPVPLDY
ncbi:MAG: cadherin-like beta sandwich domain-containing protein, partial [Clostridium sp.]|nr:cadherin-like beta sandwich domain-containing protein [Clostridium sp.]